jgi:hypothetical protein
MRNSTVAAACLVAVLLAASPKRASARALPYWPYEKLFKEADLVVIAEATAVADSGEKTKLGGWNAECIGMNTTFTPKHVLKGTLKADTFRVLHYRVGGEVLIDNGPTLVSFATRKIHLLRGKVGKAGVAKPHYLLFLKKRADGRFEAVSGQVDPSLSVREMYAPFRPRPSGRLPD